MCDSPECLLDVGEDAGAALILECCCLGVLLQLGDDLLVFCL